jgi:tetratricopeptide (TPR) repeat protein
MTSLPISPSLFISYRRTQTDAVRPVVDALQAAGIDCFFDVEDIDELADFPERVRQGIDASHAMLVWWSADYAQSDHCLAEFRRAWQHARRHSSDVGRRVWLLNPEDTGDHVFAGELNAKNFLSPPAPEQLGAWTRELKDRLDALLPEGPLADERVALLLPALHNVPIPNARFTGRGATLLRMHSKLFPAQIGAMATAAAVWLHGMGGLGKSEVAAKYAHDFAHAFPGGVFWLSFAGFEPKADLNEDEARLACYRALDGMFVREPDLQARLLRNAEGKPLPLEHAREAISRWLNDASAAGSPQPYLWILDNVPPMSPQDVRNRVLELWRAPTPAGRTVLTTRDARVADGFAAERLDELGEVDALRILSRFRPIATDERDAAATLATEVGRHTLALMLLGERVRRDGDYAKTLQTLQDTGRLARLEVIADRLRRDLGTAARSLTATFQISIASLDEDAKRLLMLSALCAPNEAIPRVLLRSAFSSDEANDAFANDAFADDAFADAVAALLGASLLGERRSRDAVDIHPLVADVASELVVLPSSVLDRGAALKRFAEALLALMTEERVLRPQGWPLMNACEPHATTLLAHLGEASPRIEYVDHTAALSFVLINLYLAQGFTSRARELSTWATLACAVETDAGELRVDGARPAVRRLLKILPVAHAQAGDYDVAVQMQRIYVDSLVGQVAPDDPELLREADNLANILRQRGRPGDLDEAQRTYERTLTAWRKRDPGSKDTLTALNNLALVEQRRGEAARAAELFEEVLARLSGMDNVEVESLQTKVALAESLREVDSKRADTLLAEALAEADRMGYPDTHPLKLRILTRLGAAAHRAGDWIRACAALRRALPAIAAIEGDRDPETVRHAWALFDAASRSGDKATADDSRIRYLQWMTLMGEDELTPEQQAIRADVIRRTGS